MKELLGTIVNWTDSGKPFAVATVVQTWGSSPRPLGSCLLVGQNREMAGSVSGGCVEGAVLKAALPLIETGSGEMLSYGVQDEEAWAVGLSCGGKIQVYAERFLAFDDREEELAAWKMLRRCLENNAPCVLVTKLENGTSGHTVVLPDGTTAGQSISDNLLQGALRSFSERKNQVLEDGGYFAQVFPRKSLMLIIGAAHITADLIRLAKLYDFETVVIDPRGVFAQKTVFPVTPDQLIEKYPSEVLSGFLLDAYTYAVILSHDPKIDDNALHILLRSEIGYIGALGSRKTHEKRMARLSSAGFSEAEITRIHAPIGMAINAQTPAEIALSVMGEIIQTKNRFL